MAAALNSLERNTGLVEAVAEKSPIHRAFFWRLAKIVYW